jgi:peptide/nickel transport system substrate-binding protein
MGPLQRNVDFRRALSLAINRDEINETVYNGLAVPRAATIASSASYYKPEWAEAYADYDPATANRMLDQLGLTTRDADGFRTRGGQRITMLLVMGGDKPPLEMELVKEYWAAVGVDTVISLMDGALLDERLSSPDHGSNPNKIYNSEEVSFYGEPDYWRPYGSDMQWGTMWEPWLVANDQVEAGLRTLSDFEGGALPGIEPPQGIKDLWAWCKAFEQSVFGSAEYRELAQKIFDFHADQIIFIGIVGESPTLLTARNNMGNIPSNYAPGLSAWEGELNYWATQIYFK